MFSASETPVSLALNRGDNMYLQESEISTDKISEVFSNAFMDVSDIEEGKFNVKGMDFPFPLRVVVNTEGKAITFTDINQLHRISELDAALICNELNKTYSFCRFYAATSNNLILSICEFDMTFEKGVIPFHIIKNFRWFEKIVGQSVKVSFIDYLNP